MLHSYLTSESLGSFENQLGSAEHRYFGRGYRKTAYGLGHIRLRSDPNGALIDALAAVHYAPDWSAKRGEVRAPHLSTIDAVVLGAWMASAYLAAVGLTACQVRRAWIRKAAVRAGTRPEIDMERIPARVVRAVSVHTGHPRMLQTILSIKVGALSTEITVEHEPADSAPLEPDSELPARDIEPLVYTTLFRATEHQVDDLKLSRGAAEVAGFLRTTSFDADDVQGLQGEYWPMPSVVDCVAIGGQLTQVLIYRQAGLVREATPNLWMRKLTMRIDRPRAMASAVARARIIESREFRRDSNALKSFQLELEICGFHLVGSVAESAEA